MVEQFKNEKPYILDVQSMSKYGHRDQTAFIHEN
jgi:hypothetical protein